MKGIEKDSHGESELKVLDQLVGVLSEDERVDEGRRRLRMVGAVEAYSGALGAVADKAEVVGERLIPYREWFRKHKAQKGPIKNIEVVLKALGLDKSKASRCNTAYEISRISGMRLAAEASGINLVEARWAKLANRILKEQKTDAGKKMTAGDLMAFCEKAIEDELKAGEAPTVKKESGPMPVDDDAGSVRITGSAAALLVRFRERFRDADAMIEAGIERYMKSVLGDE